MYLPAYTVSSVGLLPHDLLICIIKQGMLLSHFSRVQLCAIPETAAHQAPPSLGFSRQEHWSGLPFRSPMQEGESEVAQSCPTPSDPMDCSLPGSSVHGICQARVLEWVAFAFSKRGYKGLLMCFTAATVPFVNLESFSFLLGLYYHIK